MDGSNEENMLLFYDVKHAGFYQNAAESKEPFFFFFFA